jgi:hypothetical protein
MNCLILSILLISISFIGFSQDTIHKKRSHLFSYGISGFVLDGGFVKTDILDGLTTDYKFALTTVNRTSLAVNFIEFQCLFKDKIGLSASFDYTSKSTNQTKIRKGIQEYVTDLSVSIPANNYDSGIVPIFDDQDMLGLKFALVANLKVRRFAFQPFFSPLLTFRKNYVSVEMNASDPVTNLSFIRTFEFREKNKLALKTGIDIHFFLIENFSIAFRMGYFYWKTEGSAKTIDEFANQTEIVSRLENYKRVTQTLYFGGHIRFMFGYGYQNRKIKSDNK